ncbi:MAG: hypothetical protein IPJ77_23815 [Planctomycetes bacterium]|nr:hypothetical protein [Planctomycetota bacterium]
MQRPLQSSAALLALLLPTLAHSAHAWQCPGYPPPPPPPPPKIDPPPPATGTTIRPTTVTPGPRATTPGGMGSGTSTTTPAPAVTKPSTPAAPATPATPAPPSTATPPDRVAPRPPAPKTAPPPKAPARVATETPMPSGPTTAGAPTGTSRPAPTTGGRRGPSARHELGFGWDHPVVVATTFERSDRTAVAPRVVMTEAEALRAIAGQDPRPLLVLRECGHCAATERSLVTEGVDNERTFLLARWFHCVKLPADVVQPEHALHALFPDASSGHLFLSHVDGGGRVAFDGDLQRAELWSVMLQMLESAYGGRFEPTLNELAKQLDKLDTLDARVRELEKRRDALYETAARSDRSKLAKVNAELAEVQLDVDAALAAMEREFQRSPLARPASAAQR